MDPNTLAMIRQKYPGITDAQIQSMIAGVDAGIKIPSMKERLARLDKRKGGKIPTYYGKGAAATAPHWMEYLGEMVQDYQTGQRQKKLDTELGELNAAQAEAELMKLAMPEKEQSQLGRFKFYRDLGLLDTATGGVDDSMIVASEPEKTKAQETREVEEVKREIKEDAQQEKNALSYTAFNTALDKVEAAYAEASTGPISGRLFALSDANKIAEAASSQLRPLLKDIFRGTGEGTFTDADQKLLNDMVPSPTDSAETATYKINSIRTIVQSKLGIDANETEDDQEERRAEISYDDAMSKYDY